MNNNLLVIHPNDPSTKFLETLYDHHTPFNSIMVDETASNEKIKQLLTADALKDRTVMMLGHGCPGGMFAPQKENGKLNQFYREIINPSLVQFLRERTCIGIWCYANLFAEKYGLHGLFSGMVISELEEAHFCGINGFTRDEIKQHNAEYSTALAYCLETAELENVPSTMKDFIPSPDKIEEFNYNSLYYYP